MHHSSAIIDPSAKIDESVDIGPFSLIGPDVTIGKDTKIESHVILKRPHNYWRKKPYIPIFYSR